MRENYTGELSEKTDSRLNDLVLKIKRARTNADCDAFVAYKQGGISKHELCAFIAREVI